MIRTGITVFHAVFAEIMESYYLAYQAYKRLTQQAKYQVMLKLQTGEMAVFDNRRVLHGRTSFDPGTGFRHLHVCYVDRGEFESRLPHDWRLWAHWRPSGFNQI